MPYDEILIALPSANAEQMRQIVKFCRIPKKPIKTIPILNELIGRSISTELIRDISYMDLIGRDEIKLNTKSIEKFI